MTDPFAPLLAKLATGVEAGAIVGLAVVTCAPDGTPTALWVEMPGSEGGLSDGILQLAVGYGWGRVVNTARAQMPRIVRPNNDS